MQVNQLSFDLMVCGALVGCAMQGQHLVRELRMDEQKHTDVKIVNVMQSDIGVHCRNEEQGSMDVGPLESHTFE